MSVEAFYALSDEERDYWVADWEIRARECPDCGRPLQECSDPKRDWFSYRRVCYVSMEREANEARYDKLHEEKPYHNGRFTSWAEHRSRMHPYHYKAGVTIGVADDDLTPWDNFTEDVNASPVKPSVAEQAPGEQRESGDNSAGDD